MANTLSAFFIKEIDNEINSTRKCLEHITADKFEFKPHPRSMKMGDLAKLVAEIPLWIKYIVTDSEIDFVTFPHASANSPEDLIKNLENNIKAAKEALSSVDDDALENTFTLKANGQVLYTSKKIAEIPSAIRHWVHHRGQLTVYLRLNEIDVPSIYGPSADDKTFVAPK